MIPALIIIAYVLVGLVAYTYLTRKFAWRERNNSAYRHGRSEPSDFDYTMARYDSTPIALLWPLALPIYGLFLLGNAAVRATEHIIPMSKEEKKARSEMKSQ